MNDIIYNKNIEALKEKNEQLYNAMLNYKKRNDVSVIKSYADEDIIAIDTDKGTRYLNSRYNDCEFTTNMVSQYIENSFMYTYIIFGTSNFSFVRKLCENTVDRCLIVLYEPDIEIFASVIEEIDIADIIGLEKVLIVVDSINDSVFENYIVLSLEYENISTTQCVCMPGYDIIYKEIWKKVVARFKDRVELLVMSRNTEILYSKEFIGNIYENTKDLINQYSFNDLVERFNKIKNIKDVPAVLVAAGPSLDKNIEELKKINKRALIVSVDTATKTLLNHNIIPDLTITVDPHKPPILFMHSKFYKIPMIVCDMSNKEIMSIHEGKRFYFADYKGFMNSAYGKVKEGYILQTETGGSVANNAFSAIQFLGFENIILVGQDLAYPNNKKHSEGSYGQMVDNEIKNGKRYYYVEDIYGDKVLTEDNMNLYRKWFESQITRYDNINVIDATEGGAKINGTEIMTLNDAIEKYCKEEIDFKKIIDEIPACFDAKQREELNKIFDNIFDEINSSRTKLKNGKRLYERLEKLNRENKLNTKETRNLTEKIGEFATYLDEDMIMGIAAFYNRETAYELNEKAYQIKSNEVDEIKDICKKGIQLIDSYEKALIELENDVNGFNTINEDMINNICDELKKINEEINISINNDDISGINTNLKDYYKIILLVVSEFKKEKGKEYDTIIKDVKNIVKYLEEQKYDLVKSEMDTVLNTVLNNV